MKSFLPRPCKFKKWDEIILDNVEYSAIDIKRVSWFGKNQWIILCKIEWKLGDSYETWLYDHRFEHPEKVSREYMEIIE